LPLKHDDEAMAESDEQLARHPWVPAVAAVADAAAPSSRASPVTVVVDSMPTRQRRAAALLLVHRLHPQCLSADGAGPAEHAHGGRRRIQVHACALHAGSD
jgi:hypothetical protein